MNSVVQSAGSHRTTIGVLALCLILSSGCAANPVSGNNVPPTTAGDVTAAATQAPSTSASSSPTPKCATAAVCIEPGTFTTAGFLEGQLTVTVAQTWESGEDQIAEFSTAPAGTSQKHRLLFWMDVLPVDPAGQLADSVPRTAAGFAGWLSQRPNVQVTAAQTATIGTAQLPATVVDIAISPDAVNEDKGCPARACVAFLTWPNGGSNVYGIGSPGVVRLYLSDVVHNGETHLFAVAIEAMDQDELDAFAPVATEVINSASGPLTQG